MPLTGYAPNYLTYGQPTTGYGTQANPLNAFYSSSGTTGNKTTNKDLPEWLRKLGMKGDAYAGGMLKPQIRYGFWYKNGKINFADGTSFEAKKNKDGTFSYTDANGAAQTYAPTEEQGAYTKSYKDATSNQSFLDKATNAVNFELWHGKQILSNIKPSQVFFGIDPLGTKIGNAVTGSHAKPLVDQLGGALPSRYDEYGKPTGYANTLQDVAHTVAAAYGAKGLSRVGGKLIGTIGGQGTGAVSGIDEAGAMGGAGQSSSGGLGSILGGLGNGSGGNMGWGDWANLAVQLGGSYLQGRGASNAADASVKGIQAGIDEQRRQFDTTRADQMPWLQSGVAALGRLNDPNAFTTSPGYKFVRGEGNRDIENSFSARGGAQSGNALRALTQYNQNLASQEYNNWFNQQSNLAGLGQTSAQSLGALGQNNANNVSNLLGQQGNARASGIEGQTNALTGGIADFLSWYNRRRQGGG